MNTAIVHSWVGSDSITKTLNGLGYPTGKEVPVSEVFTVVKRIFDSGLNVMISHGEYAIIIYVDNKRFTQR